jgi:hypothetical protein
MRRWLTSVERITAGTRPAGVRVVNGEALLRNGVLKVDACTAEVRDTHLVHDDLNTVVVPHSVSVEHPLVEVQLVDQAKVERAIRLSPI